MTELLGRGGGEWGCTEISCVDRIPYLSREECSKYGAVFEE